MIRSRGAHLCSFILLACIVIEECIVVERMDRQEGLNLALCARPDLSIGIDEYKMIGIRKLNKAHRIACATGLIGICPTDGERDAIISIAVNKHLRHP